MDRDMQMERLEERQLLAGAQLIGIQPNDGALLLQDDIRNVAPTDLTFRFDQNQVIDEASLGDSDTVGGIQITRSNLDGTFARHSVKTIADVRRATIEASRQRVRPCLMTTATTILALIPVLTSQGRGSDIMVPMAIPSFGGMALGIVTMLVVPVLYCAIKEFKLARELNKSNHKAPA